MSTTSRENGIPLPVQPYVPKYLRKRPNLCLLLSHVNSNVGHVNQKEGRHNPQHESRDVLEIDIQLVNGHRLGINDDEIRDGPEQNRSSRFSDMSHCSFEFGDSTYRQAGFTIGRDYIRLQGKTITRGELQPSALIVQELLGQGAFSQVHKGLWKRKTKKECRRGYKESEEEKKDESATETVTEEVEVALKQCSILDSSPQRREMLLKELRALCEIQSEALVGFHGAYLQEDNVVIVMEYIDRGSLEQWLKVGRTQTAAATHMETFLASVIFQVLSGLQYLHQRRMLHRDIKPGNILLSSDGSVKLCDFGVASLKSDSSLQTTVVGTSRYMSPERLRARPYGRASDIWSLGLVILEVWTGELPWMDCDSIVSLVVTVEETPTSALLPRSMKSTNLQEVTIGCLQQEPERRIPATTLLRAPLFTVDHNLRSLKDARKLLWPKR